MIPYLLPVIGRNAERLGEAAMARNTLPTTTYECVGGPFDGDMVACGDGRCVEVSWGGACQGHYIVTVRAGGLVLRWVPFEE